MTVRHADDGIRAAVVHRQSVGLHVHERRARKDAVRDVADGRGRGRREGRNNRDTRNGGCKHGGSGMPNHGRTLA